MACFDLAVRFTPTGGMSGMAACYFNKRLIAIGGFTGLAYHGYVAQSADGVNYSLVAQGNDAINPGRAYHAIAILDNRIFISGGFDGVNALADVWMSNDGQRFTRIQANAFPARYRHAMFAHDGRLWVVGGWTGAAILGDCWCSYDGVNWTRVLNNYSRIARYASGYCCYDNRMWMAGGIGATGVLQNVYSSLNGMEWIAGQVPTDFPAVHSCTLTKFDNKMVLIGGDTAVQRGTVIDDLWYSEHGQSWILGCPDVGFHVADHATVAMEEPHRLYVIFGTDGVNQRGEVWKTVGEEFLNRAW